MEVDNLWAQPSAQELKARLIRDLFRRKGKEPVPMPRTAGS